MRERASERERTASSILCWRLRDRLQKGDRLPRTERGDERTGGRRSGTLRSLTWPTSPNPKPKPAPLCLPISCPPAPHNTAAAVASAAAPSTLHTSPPPRPLQAPSPLAPYLPRPPTQRPCRPPRSCWPPWRSWRSPQASACARRPWQCESCPPSPPCSRASPSTCAQAIWGGRQAAGGPVARNVGRRRRPHLRPTSACWPELAPPFLPSTTTTTGPRQPQQRQRARLRLAGGRRAGGGRRHQRLGRRRRAPAGDDRQLHHQPAHQGMPELQSWKEGWAARGGGRYARTTRSVKRAPSPPTTWPCLTSPSPPSPLSL